MIPPAIEGLAAAPRRPQARAYRPAPMTPPEAEGRSTFWGTWPDYKYMQGMAERAGGARVTYLDGRIEFMTLSLEHERRKAILSHCLEAWLVAKDIELYPHGSATLEAEARQAGKEPDASYCFHEEKAVPDLAIEIAISHGGMETLELYRRWQIPEVWIWHRNRLHVFHLEGGDYVEAEASRWFPDLNLPLLTECVKLDNTNEARRRFLAGK